MDKQFYRALIITILLILLVGKGMIHLGANRFSLQWFFGCFDILCCYLIMLYINYNFIKLKEKKAKKKERKEND